MFLWHYKIKLDSQKIFVKYKIILNILNTFFFFFDKLYATHVKISVRKSGR